MLVVSLGLDVGRIRKWGGKRTQVGESEEVPSLRMVGARTDTTSCGEYRRVNNEHVLVLP